MANMILTTLTEDRPEVGTEISAPKGKLKVIELRDSFNRSRNNTMFPVVDLPWYDIYNIDMTLLERTTSVAIEERGGIFSHIASSIFDERDGKERFGNIYRFIYEDEVNSVREEMRLHNVKRLPSGVYTAIVMTKKTAKRREMRRTGFRLIETEVISTTFVPVMKVYIKLDKPVVDRNRHSNQ